jgi:putative sterol carrier protein
MSVAFLSDTWFDRVTELTASTTGLEIAPGLKGMKINVTVNNNGAPVNMCLDEGLFKKGHVADAPATLILTRDLAYKILIQNDQAAGMQGFMSGDLRVEGDMSKIMALQSVSPSASQKALLNQIKAETQV